MNKYKIVDFSISINNSEVVELYEMDIQRLITFNIKYIGIIEHLSIKSDTVYIAILLNE